MATFLDALRDQPDVLRANIENRPMFSLLVREAFETLRDRRRRVAPPLVPQRTDPEVVAAGQAAIREERLRRGRASTILTSRRGTTEDELGSISRPQARGATLLGGA